VASRRGAECVSDLGGLITAQMAIATITATATKRMRSLAGRDGRQSFHFRQLGLEVFAIEQIDNGNND
jgi:hypothetical protein